MSLLSKLSSQEFSTRRDRWEELLKAELKVPEVGSKVVKQSLDAGTWPTLSLEAPMSVQLPVGEQWKKAAQTYVQSFDQASIQEDLENGVRNFFFHKEFLNASNWKTIESTLGQFDRAEELEVFLLGQGEFTPAKTKFTVIDEQQMATGRLVHELGGSNVQELGLMAHQLIEQATGDRVYLALFVDSQFFRNIAKLRAAKLLASRILELKGEKKDIRVIALTSFREWTLYERYSNLLRNDASVASAYIAGADYVQSSGYQTLHEVELGSKDDEHLERSRRMARNTSHVLALESLLGVVGDAAFGSYHLESLSQHYCQEAWSFMQKCQQHKANLLEFIKKESAPVAEARLQKIKTRKHVLAGLNDFPDVKERLNVTKKPEARFFRVGQGFESLRLKVEEMKNPPLVHIALFGDLAALNARINFAKNYFELLGLKVHEPHHSETDLASFQQGLAQNKADIVVLVASDDDYAKLGELKLEAQEKFLAGKYELAGFNNLFAGQNVFEVLEALVNRWGSK